MVWYSVGYITSCVVYTIMYGMVHIPVKSPVFPQETPVDRISGQNCYYWFSNVLLCLTSYNLLS